MTPDEYVTVTAPSRTHTICLKNRDNDGPSAVLGGFNVEASVPATFHLNRWDQELDEIPFASEWGLDVSRATYAYGSRFGRDLATPEGMIEEVAESSDGTRVPVAFPPEWWRDGLRVAYHQGVQIAHRADLRARLVSGNIRCPPHSPMVAFERIISGRICRPDGHEWVDLDGYYWRECRKCGLADVTVADFGQPIETPGG